jgi:hypothetical protein
MSAQTDYRQLAGGTANRGRVIRIGEAVHRPSGDYTPAVHRLLAHLQDGGFAGAPGVVEALPGREVLTYIPGRAATEPLARWALIDAALVSVGVLLRDYHRHASSFDGAGLHWQRPVPEPWRGTLVTHNDLNPANVIFRGGRAVAFIDFDLAAPGTAAWELAVAACFWAPLRDGADIDDSRRGRILARFRLLLDAYGADGALRRDVALAARAANRWIADVIEEAANSGHPAFGQLWERAMSLHERADRWLTAHRDGLLGAAG